MKRTTLSSLVLMAALTAFPIAAQDSMNVHIPFNFSVGERSLPAGNYTLNTQIAPGAVLIRSNDDMKNAVMLLTTGVSSRKVSEDARLVFQRYGESYFLSQLWKPGYDVGRQFPESKLQREVASRASQQTVLRASTTKH
jgi:hypothetical protein